MMSGKECEIIGKQIKYFKMNLINALFVKLKRSIMQNGITT